MKDLVSPDHWVVDKKRETNPDKLNSITKANGTDQPDFIRIESNDLQTLASNKFIPPKSSLVVTKRGEIDLAVEDHKISDWAKDAYAGFNVKLVVEASIAAQLNPSSAVSKQEKVILGEVNGLKLVPKVARDVQTQHADINRHVERNVTTQTTIGPDGLFKPVEYNNPANDVAGDAVDDSWLLVNTKDGTLWRQAMFDGLFAKMEARAAANGIDLEIMSTRIIIKLATPGSAPSYTGSSGDIRMLINEKDDDNVLVKNQDMPQLKNKVDPLKGFNGLVVPTIVDEDAGAETSKKRLEIPITLSSDGLEQVNIMIAHSTDHEAYFNDLRADGKNARNFRAKSTNDAGVSSIAAEGAAAGGGALDSTTAATRNKDSIQLASSPGEVSAANAGKKPSELVTDAPAATGDGIAHLDLFFFQKVDKDGQRQKANVDFQIDPSTAASDYSKTLSGNYVLHAAIPEEGDYQFLLLNVVTNGGNRKFVAYKKGDTSDGNTAFQRVN